MYIEIWFEQLMVIVKLVSMVVTEKIKLHKFDKREHFVVETHFESKKVDMQINLIKEFDFFVLTSSASLSQKWSNFLKKGENTKLISYTHAKWQYFRKGENRHTKYLILNDSTCHVNVRKCNPGALWCMYE